MKRCGQVGFAERDTVAGGRHRDQAGWNRPQLRGLLQGARSRAGCSPAAAVLSSYTDVDSPARGLTFSAMTPNAAKRRRFRTKRDEVEIFLLSAPALGTARESLGVAGQSEERKA
jgi:hypothetical protein